jgi:hypothetical protein
MQHVSVFNRLPYKSHCFEHADKPGYFQRHPSLHRTPIFCEGRGHRF